MRVCSHVCVALHPGSVQVCNVYVRIDEFPLPRVITAWFSSSPRCKRACDVRGVGIRAAL